MHHFFQLEARTIKLEGAYNATVSESLTIAVTRGIFDAQFKLVKFGFTYPLLRNVDGTSKVELKLTA